GPVAQLDRALPSEGRGRTFESCRVRHYFKHLSRQPLPSPQYSERIASTVAEKYPGDACVPPGRYVISIPSQRSGVGTRHRRYRATRATRFFSVFRKSEIRL